MLNELKTKYNRVKDKCFKLNTESDFYNQTITVFLTIKKVLEKQNKFTVSYYESQLKKMNPAFGEKNSNGSDNNNGLRMTNSSNSSKRNLFQKKSKQDFDDINDQRPDELKNGI